MANRTSYINDAMNVDLEMGVRITLKSVSLDTKFMFAKNDLKPISFSSSSATTEVVTIDIVVSGGGGIKKLG
jgi:hypothetical protein